MRRTDWRRALIVLLAIAGPNVLGAFEREQLPSTVRPLHYELALLPDADNLGFSGKVQIEIAVSTPNSSITLNADELVLDQAVVDGSDRATRIELDTKRQRATLQFGHTIAAGNHQLTIDYHGRIGKATVGFFAMDYDSSAGKRRTLATNFEPASERRFMPSWDEPALKATLSLTVTVPADRMAVSNMPIASTETLPNNQQRVHFAATPKMSTYLYFLGIGDFERISTKVDGTEVGVVVNRGDTEKGRYALGEAAQLLHYYNAYFGVAYPLPKLDLVVAPGMIKGGAMENWGAIFYSQEALLFDPKLSTESDRQGVFLVVSHEMSHQWFGDLVTMAWWDNLWLNEGFARWMQTKAADDLHPEWKTGLQALAVSEAGKRADAKPSTHPIVQPVDDAAQAEQAFDNITYDEGAAVIGMLEAYVGPAAFRDGVRVYMRAHAYGNTVDADLWREVQAAAYKPVLEIEADFTTQPGLPLIKVERRQPNQILLTEGRFVEDPTAASSGPAQQWRIPLAVRATRELQTHLLGGGTPTTVAVPATGPVVVNAGQSSFARTLYPDPMLATLTSSLSTIDTADQIGLLYDTWALGESGYGSVTNYLDLAHAAPVTADPLVWRQIVNSFVTIDRFYTGDFHQSAFRSFARSTLGPMAAKLGWDSQPNDAPNVGELREALLRALSRFGDEAVIAEARRRFDVAIDDAKDVPPATRKAVISIVARNADSATLDRLLATLRNTRDPLKKATLLEMLSQIADRSGAARVIDASMGPDAPSGSAVMTLFQISSDHPNLAWNRALPFVEQANSPVYPQMKRILIPMIAAASGEQARVTDLQSYANQHIPPGARQSVESAVSTIKLNAKFKAERLPQINEWLATNATR
ncbi:MAG: M1 family metallopeptidase [Bryobacteraceae bacterium]